MEPKIAKKLHRLVYTLLYPAVLGTMIVAIVSSFSNNTNKLSCTIIGFAVFLSFYFSSQHVENSSDEEAETYTLTLLLFNILEIITMFGLFRLLGFVDPKYGLDIKNATWDFFYYLLAVVFILPVIARLFDKQEVAFDTRESMLTILSSLAVVTALCGMWFLPNVLVLIILIIILAIYVSNFFFENA